MKDDKGDRRVRTRIIDATLREGTQMPGAHFDANRSVVIARLLGLAGVDMVECGHPASGLAERSRVCATVHALPGLPVLSHARALESDVRAVAETGAEWVGIFLGVNEVSRRVRVRRNWNQLMRMLSRSIRLARRLGLKVRYTVEDASRTTVEDLLAAYRVALEAGAHRVCLADTVGILEPGDASSLTRTIKEAYPDTPLEVHLHDDRGLSLACALASIDAGADWIASSINGVGERCGIVDTVELMVNLAMRRSRDWPDAEALNEASRRVGAYSRAPRDVLRPMTGRHAFTHTAKLHRNAVATDASAYEWVRPDRLGRVRTIFNERECSPTSVRFLEPQQRPATELRAHRSGPGVRHVMIDEGLCREAGLYAIVRTIPDLADHGPGHVDPHAHDVDSLFMFMGDEDDRGGLVVEVNADGQFWIIESPASIFIPAGWTHSYRVVSGSGTFVNVVLAGDYNSTLLSGGRTEATPPRPMSNENGDRPTTISLSGAVSPGGPPEAPVRPVWTASSRGGA